MNSCARTLPRLGSMIPDTFTRIKRGSLRLYGGEEMPFPIIATSAVGQ